jgi:uncharacterized protein YxeA
MKKILLVMFFLTVSVILNSKPSYYNIRVTNYDKHTKHVMIKFKNRKGVYITKEFKLRKNKDYRFKSYDKTFYLFSVYYLSGGKVRYSVKGKDDVGFMKLIGSGRPAWFKKIECETYLQGFLKTVHLGI